MAKANQNYLLARIDDIQRNLKERPKDFVEADIDGVTHEILEDVAKWVDLGNLNARLEALASIDIESLEFARTSLENANLGQSFEISPGRSIDPKATLIELKRAIEELNVTHTKKSELGLSWELDHHLAAHFKKLLLCAAKVQADLSELSGLVAKKVDFLTDNWVAEVWARLRREFDEEHMARMQDLDSVLPSDFLQFENARKAREK
jgi:hypothetical protein